MKMINPFYGCIYMATNKINNKIYIGQTRRPLPERMKKHFDRIEDGSHFHNALRKYGRVSFRWEIIDIADNQNELNKMESELIKKYDSMNPEIGYNLTSGGESPIMSPDVCQRASKRMKGYKPTPETIEKMRIASTGRPGYWKGKKLPAHVVEGMKNRKYTAEQRKRMSEVRKGSIPWNKNKSGYKTVPCSEEKREVIRAATYKQWEGKTRQVLCIETGDIFPSAHRAQTELGIKNVMQACIHKCAAGGYHWKYVDDIPLD